jgi:hypothetical protein
VLLDHEPVADGGYYVRALLRIEGDPPEDEFGYRSTCRSCWIDGAAEAREEAHHARDRGDYEGGAATLRESLAGPGRERCARAIRPSARRAVASRS